MFFFGSGKRTNIEDAWRTEAKNTSSAETKPKSLSGTAEELLIISGSPRDHSCRWRPSCRAGTSRR